MPRPTDPGNESPAFSKHGASVSGTGALAWIAAGLGMLLFALAAVALVTGFVTEEQFWLLSAAGLAFYFCAHCLGVSYHSY